MLPSRSIAALPINLYTPSPGAHVPWSKIDQFPDVLRNSYQRMPAIPVPSVSTVCVTTIDWCAPKLRYWSLCMSRFESTSMRFVVPGCGTQLRAVVVQLRTESNGWVGRSPCGTTLSVGVPAVQSTVALNISIRAAPPLTASSFIDVSGIGAFAGGAFGPSASAGRTLVVWLGKASQALRAGLQFSILSRSNAP